MENSEGGFKVAFSPHLIASFKHLWCLILMKSPILGIIIRTKNFFAADRMKIFVLNEQTCLWIVILKTLELIFHLINLSFSLI